MRYAFLLITLLMSANAFAQAPASAPAAQAEAFNMKFEGAELVDELQTGFNTYTIQDEKNKSQVVEGVGRRLIYRASGATSYEVLRNYEEALKEAGYTIIVKIGSRGAGAGMISPVMSMGSVMNEFCNQPVNSCAFAPGQPMGGHIFNNADSNTFYLSAKKATENGEAYAAVAVGEWNKDPRAIRLASGKTLNLAKGDVAIGVDHITPKQLTKKMVKESASYIEQAITEKGKVDLYGIYFDFDKATLKQESDETLGQIAEVLKKNTQLKLRVVGHTDSAGMPDYNQKLSEERARAVLAALTGKYGIDASRLQAEGKGASAPVASNDTDEGRAKNRRVELVRQ